MPHGFPHIPNFGPDLTQLLAQQQRFNRLGPIRAGEQIGAGLVGGSQSLARALQLLGQREFAAGEAEKQRTFTGDLAKQRRDAIEAASQRTAEATREAAELGARTRTTLEAERTKKQDLLEKARIKREQFALEESRKQAERAQELAKKRIDAIQAGNAAAAADRTDARAASTLAANRRYAVSIANLKLDIQKAKNDASRQARLLEQRTKDKSFRDARIGLDAIEKNLSIGLSRLAALRSRINKEFNPRTKQELEQQFDTLNAEVFGERGTFARFQAANEAIISESGVTDTTAAPTPGSTPAAPGGFDDADILDDVKRLAGGK